MLERGETAARIVKLWKNQLPGGSTEGVSHGCLKVLGLLGFNAPCDLIRLLNVPKRGSRSLIFLSMLNSLTLFYLFVPNCATEKLFANADTTPVWNWNFQHLLSTVSLLAGQRAGIHGIVWQSALLAWTKFAFSRLSFRDCCCEKQLPDKMCEPMSCCSLVVWSTKLNVDNF